MDIITSIRREDNTCGRNQRNVVCLQLYVALTMVLVCLVKAEPARGGGYSVGVGGGLGGGRGGFGGFGGGRGGFVGGRGGLGGRGGFGGVHAGHAHGGHGFRGSPFLGRGAGFGGTIGLFPWMAYRRYYDY